MEGILTGFDQNQEWMLPWWYRHVRQVHPELPIAFGDLGMSEQARHWCQQRGIFIEASQIPAYPEPSSSELGWPYNGMKWFYHEVPSLPKKTISFRKPFLMKQSPFDKTLWLDLDCQVVGDLFHLFSLPLQKNKLAIRSPGRRSFAMVATDGIHGMAVKSYNSGVVMFEKQSPLLDFWIELITHASHNFIVDDQVLAFAICKYEFSVVHFKERYNWNVCWKFNPNAVIMHWMGEMPKNILKLELQSNGELFEFESRSSKLG